jgi:HAD superfamily hydrolase (TIGR01509 family)
LRKLAEYQAIIFDMDGLLIDSERIYLECFIEACHQHQFEADENIYLQCIGTSWQRTKEILTEGYGPEFPYHEVVDQCRALYELAITEHPLPVKEGAVPLLKAIDSLQIPKAVATSTERDKAMEKLRSVDLLHYFSHVVGGDQVADSKPLPQIYLKVAKCLGISPDNCLALEDSDNGVRSAHAAGMDVIQIPDLVTPSIEVKALGHPIMSSLSEVQNLV